MLNAFSFAQSDEKALMDKLCSEACQKIEKVDIKSKDDASTIEVKLGTAFLPVIQDHQAEIKRVWNLDINNPGEAQKIGEKLGQSLVFTCPRFQEITGMLMQKDPNLMSDVKDRLADRNTAAPASQQVTGTIAKIEGQDVASVFVNTDDGETVKLLWLDDFEGSSFLTNGNYSGKKFQFSYIKRLIYQPQSKSYKEVKVISGLSAA